MYELWIESSDGTWILADLGKDKPAMNYSSNDIAKLQHRNVDYSQRIYLPITSTNSNIFNCVDQFDAINETPYRRHACRLYSNGCALAGVGSFIIILRIREDYECQILSGTVDLFQSLKDTPMSALHLGYYTRSRSTAQSGEYHKFLASTFIQGGADIMGEMNGVKAFPFIPMGAVLDNMIKAKGYSLKHDVGPDLDKVYTSLVSLNTTEGSQHSLIYEAVNKGAIPIGEFMDLQVMDVATDGNMIIGDRDYFLRFTAPYSGKIRIQFSVKEAYNSRFTRQIVGENINLGVVSGRFDVGDQGSETKHTSYDITKGESFTIQFKNERVASNGNITNASALVQISYTSIEADQVPEGARVYIAPNMGFKNQYGYFETFLQLFGLTVTVDDESKTVYAYTMEKVYENKAKAIDWSKKLHHDKNYDLSFTIGDYAQYNSIAFEEDTEDRATNVGIFKIDNQTLQSSKEQFKIVLEAGNDNKVLGKWSDSINEENTQKVANIPMLDEKGVFRGAKPHLVKIQDESSFVGKNNQIYKRAVHQSMQSLINVYYKSLTSKMLEKARMIEVEFYLTDDDIEIFDKFIPIYIDYFGAYFYVNKIKNYVSGQLTACELIKL